MEDTHDHDKNGLDQQPVVKRQVYRSPQLIEYGSIEDLTQGSAGAAFDAAGTTPQPAR